jgi:Protein of unknown function (DUF4239)
MQSLETSFWSLLFIVVLPALAIGGTLLVRRAVGADVLARHNDVAGFIYAVIGVLYAVLLGFTAIIVWEQFRRAQEGAELEANALADLYRDAQVFPAAVREEVATGLRDYARLVVDEEWPAMAAGQSSPETWEAYNLLWRTYYEFAPQDDHERTWYRESVQRLNVLGDQRRNRLLSNRSGVPVVMWAVLLGAGAVTIGFSFLFGTRHAAAQAVMTGALALTIGVVLLSILALEHPFAGITRVDPEAFEQVREILGGVSQPEAGTSP